MLHHSKSPQDTQALARTLLKEYPDHSLWLLHGDLAAGKTTFAKGVAQALGLDPKSVKSPTFAYVKEYEGLIHYDLYRLTQPDAELQALLEEQAQTQAHILIEWPERMEYTPTQKHLRIYFEHAGENQRRIRVEAH